MRVRRLRVAFIVSLGLVVCLGPAALKKWASSEPMRAKVRAKVCARLGEGARLGDEFTVDWFGTVRLGPLTIAAQDPKAPPVVFIRRLAVRPRWLALWRGALEPGLVRFEEVTIEAGEDAAEVRGLFERARTGTASSGPKVNSEAKPKPWPELRFERLVARASRAGRPVEFGIEAGRLVIHHDPTRDEVHLEGDLRVAGGGRVHFASALNAEGIRTADLRFRDGVELKALLPQPSLALTGGRVTGEVHAHSSQRHRVGEASWQLVLDEATIMHPRFAAEAVGPMRLATHGHLRWDLELKVLVAAPLALAFGDAEQINVIGDGSVQLDSETFSIQARTVDLDYQAAMAAMPLALAPRGQNIEVSGPLSVKLDMKGPLRRPLDWGLNVKIDLTTLRQVARAQPQALNRPFVYQATLFDGRRRNVMVGPSNSAFTPLAQVPRALIRAVLLSEDSMFMSHQGFDFFELKNDLFAQFTAPDHGEHVLRGASTLTQQLAKNLFLSRERTYARKVREAFLTLALEAAIPKERLLEIYLNIIEWGPGLNGVGEAAAHYFGKQPLQLSVKEAAYLATLIPSPVRLHGFFAKGAVPEVWERRVADVLIKMHSAGDLTDGELAEAMATPLRFAGKP